MFGRRLLAVTGCVAVLSLHTAPVAALPAPRSEEWWFRAWEIPGKVWPLTKGAGVIIAVVDSGIQADLPDLRGVVLRGTTFDIPAGGDGRRDFDTEKGGHGTAMAALMAGQGRGSGMVGVALESKLLPITSMNGDYTRTIHYAVDHGAKVINMSSAAAAAHCTDENRRAVAYAIEHDVVLVASAGNEGDVMESLNSPANCPGVLAVGAVGADLKIWQKSTPGDNVMIAAPGYLVGTIGKHGYFDDPVGSGTSQAAALTSSVVALVRSRYPKMTGREVVQRILATAKDVGPKGWDKKSGYGAVIPYRALTAKVPHDAPNPVYEIFDRKNSEAQRAVASARERGVFEQKSEDGPGNNETLIRVGCIAVAVGLVTIILLVVRGRRSGSEE